MSARLSTAAIPCGVALAGQRRTVARHRPELNRYNAEQDATQPAAGNQAPRSSTPFWRKRATIVLALLAVLFVAWFEDDGRREDAAQYIREDLDPRIRAVYPLALYDAFEAHNGRCEQQRIRIGEVEGEICGSPSIITRVVRLPASLWAVLDQVLSQGLVAVIVLAIPAGLLVLLATRTVLRAQPILIVHPSFWLLLFLAVGLAGYVVKAAGLFALLVVERTIASVAVLTTAYFVYDKLQMYRTFNSWLDWLFAPASTAVIVREKPLPITRKR